MEFISIVNPGEERAASSRKIHSHAAKVAHARSRRLRMAQYIEKNAKTVTEGDETPRNQPQNSGCVLEARERVRWMSSSRRPDRTQMLPKSIDGAFEHEPLAGFLSTLTAKEHFLFNHCTSVSCYDSYPSQRC